MMSVIIKYKKNYFLMSKGADISIAEKSENSFKNEILQEIDDFLDLGLRVMFMGIWLLSENEFKNFI